MMTIQAKAWADGQITIEEWIALDWMELRIAAANGLGVVSLGSWVWAVHLLTK